MSERDLLRDARDYVAIFADPPRLFQFADVCCAADVDAARDLLARIDDALSVSPNEGEDEVPPKD